MCTTYTQLHCSLCNGWWILRVMLVHLKLTTAGPRKHVHAVAGAVSLYDTYETAGFKGSGSGTYFRHCKEATATNDFQTRFDSQR
jgi:hypothetical protein